MSVRAKVSVAQVTDNGYTEQTKMHCVSTNNNAEDNTFSKATPCLTIDITVDNPGAKGFFKAGKKYYLDFTEAPE